MSAAEQTFRGQKTKTSKLAVASIIMPIVLLIIGYICIAIGPALILSAPLGIVLGVMALVSINKSKGKIKGIGFAISGIIISFIIITCFICLFFLLQMVISHEKPYDDSNPEAIIEKIGKVCDLDFPEKKNL